MISFENDCLNLSSLWASLVAEELVRLGVTTVCIAPGSRSTPLVVACAKRPEIKKIVCQDERSAGFFALGCARATGKPAAVIVTSGSAVANLLPSVVEASNDCVPMLLMTADRPPELRGVGANQTIDQVKIFGSFVRWFMDMPVPDVKVPLRFLLSSIDEAVHQSTSNRSGPVHLNFMFREPFVPDAIETWDADLLRPIKKWMESKGPLSSHNVRLADFCKIVKAAESGIIVAGALKNRGAEDSVLCLAEKIGWPILPDILSNLRFRDSPMIAHHADLALLDNALKNSSSDVVLQIGGRIVSKRLQEYLEANESFAHVIIDDHRDRNDPSCLATHRVQSEVDVVVAELIRLVPTQKSSGSKWLSKSKLVEVELKALELSQDLTEIGVARSLLEVLDDAHFLFVASSMPIRDLNMFAKAKERPPRIYANRGASGIDGIISSACGVAKGLNKRGVLFSGDLTFLHDTNGLSLLKSLDEPLVIVVVNNQGGGIFAMLDIHRQREIFTPYFDAHHETNLRGICEAHGVKHLHVSNLSDWKLKLNLIPHANEHLMIEVASEKWRNREEHDQIREAIRAKFRV